MATTPNVRQIEDAVIGPSTTPSAGQVLTATGSGQETTWTDADQIGGVVAFSAGWDLSTVTAIADPGDGIIRTDAALNASTILAISATANNTADATTILDTISQSDLIYIQEKDTPANWVKYRITGAVVNNTTWFQVPVEFVEEEGALAKGVGLFVRFAYRGVDLITTEGGQTINGTLSLSGGGFDVVKTTSGNIATFSTSDVGNVNVDVRNDEGGLKIYCDSDTVRFVETDNLGAFEKTWIIMQGDAGVILQHNEIPRFRTLSTGARVDGVDFGVNGILYTWPAADGSNGQTLTTNGVGVLSWDFKVSSVSGGDNVTITGGVQNPVVNLDSSQTHATFDLNTTDATGAANAITAGANGVIEWGWDGTNTSVALQHNGSDSLVVDENGITLNQALNFSTSANISVTGSYDLTATSFAQFISDSGTNHSEVVLNGASARFNAGDPTGLGNGSLNLNAYLDSGVLSCNLFLHATGGPSATGQSTLTIAGNTAYQIRDNSGTLQQAWFGATPVAQQSITGSIAGASDVANSVADALIALGLATDNRTA